LRESDRRGRRGLRLRNHRRVSQRGPLLRPHHVQANDGSSVRLGALLRQLHAQGERSRLSGTLQRVRPPRVLLGRQRRVSGRRVQEKRTPVRLPRLLLQRSLSHAGPAVPEHLGLR
jgi:hypothetical protein